MQNANKNFSNEQELIQHVGIYVDRTGGSGGNRTYTE